jgi:hypothetical protein
MRTWVALLLLVLSSPASARPPTLVFALYAKPAARPQLRQLIDSSEREKLRQWRARALVSGYELLFARYPDRSGWDAMEVLHFSNDAAMARWRAATGGLSDRPLLSLADTIETTVAETVRNEGTESGAPAVLVLPYQVFIPPADYLRYLDGYTIPQFRGWMKAGVLDSFDILTSRYPAGRPWSALIVLRYHDEAALARREEVVASTRKALSGDPRWKAFSDSKKKIRNENALVVADEVASGRDIARGEEPE